MMFSSVRLAGVAGARLTSVGAGGRVMAQSAAVPRATAIMLKLMSFILLLGALSAAPVNAQSEAKAEWVTLGTAGGPPIRATQSQISNALVIGDAIYLFDVGAGTLRQLAAAHLDINNVRAVFLTHHHVDHVTDLGPVMISRWSTGKSLPILDVVGPPGAKEMTRKLAAAYAPVELAAYPLVGPVRTPLPATVRARDLMPHMSEPTLVFQDSLIRVFAISAKHYSPPATPIAVMPTAVSYRIETAGRTIAYTGDTGYSPLFIKLAQNADLMVSEVVDVPGARAAVSRTGPPSALMEARFQNWAFSHSSPVEVGEMAAAAHVKSLVLTHFVGSWESDDQAGYTLGLSEKYHGPVRLAHDLDRF